jgi:cytoskeletal protein CcmA (bactofilin family)
MALPHARETHAGEINTLLGRGSQFEGKLTFEGTVRIDGKLSGEIFSDDVLVVGEGAEVHAEIDIGEIIVQGLVVGNIRAKRAIEIHAPGKVRGDVTTPSLQIDKGVVFEGRSYMEGVVEGKKGAGGAGGGEKKPAAQPDKGAAQPAAATPAPGGLGSLASMGPEPKKP